MPTKAMNVSVDSQNPSTWSADQRPPLRLTQEAIEGLETEVYEARQAWLKSLLAIPVKFGPRRTAAVAKTLKLRERYEALIGHKAGYPPAEA